MKLSLYVGTPCYGEAVTAPYHQSILRLHEACIRTGLPFRTHLLSESLIPRARDRVAHDFLKSGSSHLLFIDADIGFEPQWVFEMLALERPLVAGSYPIKRHYWQQVADAAQEGVQAERLPLYATRLAVNPEGPLEVDDSQCMKMRDLATGFMLIERDVFFAIAGAHPELYVRHPDNPLESMYAWFLPFIENKIYLSEDYAFCRRWQQLGGESFAYLPAVCDHHGNCTYKGAWRRAA